MKYLAAHFKITCPEDTLQTARDLLAYVAGEAGFETFEDTPNGIDGYVQEQLLDRQLLDNGIDKFPIEGIDITYIINKVEDQDWNATWEAIGFEPINIDNRIIVYDAKSQVPPHTSETIVIGIDARQAFGTGTHETTQMVIASLLETDLQGKSVLDCGCGTGILSIAAAKSGARRCTGYDIDEWSVENSRHNALLNNVEIDVKLGDASIVENISGMFDVIMANINRNILLADMPVFVSKMNPGGSLIMSGFYQSDTDIINQKAKLLGLIKTGQKTNGEWTCLTFCK